MNPLPIDPYLPEIVSTLRLGNGLILTAPPGAGKTTRVPRALYDAGFAAHGEILILEPRRIAARFAAARVSQELGERLGGTVGYSIRFEDISGPKTRIRFMTEAILARRIVRDPDLRGVSAVIIDEFHERHLATDLALAFLRQLQSRNKSLKFVVMSATMNVEPLRSFLPHAAFMSAGESPYEITIDYEERPDDRPLHEKIRGAVSRLLLPAPKGDVLVFLPGAAEIRRSIEALRPMAERGSISLCALHGDMSSAEQLQAVEPAANTKVILATNVAETSLTIPGIAAVVDSGLARIAGHSPWSGFPTLTTAKISKSSATQRAGRAGRTQQGRVLRLYTKHDYTLRPDFETPEIKRADLTETVLLLHGSGIGNISAFEWFEAPAKPAIEAAESLLLKLGAVSSGGHITDTGRRMLRLPIHPRLARLIVEGETRHVGSEAALLAALLSERDIRLEARTQFADPSGLARRQTSGRSDLLELLDRFRESGHTGPSFRRQAELDLDVRAVQSVQRAQKQLNRLLSREKPSPVSTPKPADREAEEALLIAALAAFPDRVAKRRKPSSRELLLAGGGSATLSPLSVVHDASLMVAVDAEERKETRRLNSSGTKIRCASGIEAEWLAALFPDSIFEKSDLIWNERAGRVEDVRKTFYEEIVLEESVRTAATSDEASRILSAAVLARKLASFHDIDSLSALRVRLDLMARHYPEVTIPDISEDTVCAAAEKLCEGKVSLAELESLSLIGALMNGLTSRQRERLSKEVPERITLKSGRTVRVHYDSTKNPWIESRLQDFFGLFSTPVICGGRVSLTVHLLAPNRRPVQITNDLRGFWTNHYPSVRRELQRRYPKHSWPDPGSLMKGH
jgi:ATP-dependent helicase HrpB